MGTTVTVVYILKSVVPTNSLQKQKTSQHIWAQYLITKFDLFAGNAKRKVTVTGNKFHRLCFPQRKLSTSNFCICKEIDI